MLCLPYSLKPSGRKNHFQSQEKRGEAASVVLKRRHCGARLEGSGEGVRVPGYSQHSRGTLGWEVLESVGKNLLGAEEGRRGGGAGRTPTELQGEEEAQKQLILLLELFL